MRAGRERGWGAHLEGIGILRLKSNVMCICQGGFVCFVGSVQEAVIINLLEEH